MNPEYFDLKQTKDIPILLNIARRFWPELDSLSTERRLIGTGEVVSFLLAFPLTLTGLIWLVSATDLNILRDNLGLILVFAALMIFFNQLGFFLIIELRDNRYGSAAGSLSNIPLWSGVFLFGPTVFWLSVFWVLAQFVLGWRNTNSKTARWGLMRGLTMNLASETLVSMTTFTIYRALGGQFPLTSLNFQTLWPAALAFISHFVLYTLIWAGYLSYHTWAQQVLTGANRSRPILKFFLLAIGLPQMANPFAILAAGMYAQDGLLVYIFFISGMLAVAYLSRRLSWSAERSRQQSRLLEKLEQLGRAIINAPPDTEDLPAILEEHLVNMFPAGRVVVWVFPDEILFIQPREWQPDLDLLWPWLLDRTEGDVFLARDSLPWMETNQSHSPLVVAPIRDIEHNQTFGGIYLELHTLAQPWDRRALKNLCPAIQALSAQIASAFNQSKIYLQAIEYERVSEELKLAGSIQASLLPHQFPDMPGWQFAVTLDPAGETSGDFFDIIPLEDGKVGLVIADVLDKGVGPAIYMTLSRTLIRTYATEFNLLPDLVFFATNERILKDTRANLFVTAFFGILDPKTGELVYSNAGHNPPYLLNSQNGHSPKALTTTGFPIGIDEEATWERASVSLDPGDVLILYTDGVPDAQNLNGNFYKEGRLVAAIKENLGQSAEALQRAILDSVYTFVGDAPAFDDITLMVLKRDS